MPPSDFCTRILRNTCSLSVRIRIAISFFIKTSGTVNILSQKHRRGQGRGLHPHSELANPETQQLWLQPPDGCCVRGAPARTPCPLRHVGPCACSLSPQKEGVCLHTPPRRNTQPPAPPSCCLLSKRVGGMALPVRGPGQRVLSGKPLPTSSLALVGPACQALGREPRRRGWRQPAEGGAQCRSSWKAVALGECHPQHQKEMGTDCVPRGGSHCPLLDR